MKKINMYSLCVLLATVFLVGCGNNYHGKTLETTTESSSETVHSDALTTPALETETKEIEYLENNCKLIVKGKDISGNCYVYMYFDKRYVELPLITILEELGASASWKSDSKVHFEYADKTYILDINEDSFYEKGDTWSLIDPPPGTPAGLYVKKIANEYMINDPRIRYLLIELGFTINIDYDQATVSIEEK